MGNNTINFRRGSVRGPPPGMYAPFGTYGADTDGIQSSVNFFFKLLKIAVAYVLICFLLIVWYAFIGKD